MSIAARAELLHNSFSVLRNSFRVGLAWIFTSVSYTVLVYVLERAVLFQTSVTTEMRVNLLLWGIAFSFALLMAKLTIKHAGVPPASIGVVALVTFLLYFQTSASWVFVNRDPGFLSSGSLLFWDAPLRQLSPIAFEGLKWPGFYAVENGIAVQGFPGFYALASNEVFFTGTFPQFTTQVTGALTIFWIGWVLCKIGKSNTWLSVALQIALATSTPWLYVARNPFTETLAALAFLVGLFAVMALAKSKGDSPHWLWGSQLIVIFGVANFTRIDGPVTTVLPLGLMVIALFIKDKWRDRKSLYILVVALLFSIVTFLQGKVFSPVYFKDLEKYAHAELALLSGFVMIVLVASAIPVTLAAVRNVMRMSWLDTIFRITPSLVFLVAPLSWLLRTSDARFESALMPVVTISSYLGVATGLAFAVGYIATSLRRRWLFDEYGWLLIGSVFVFSTYLQNPLVYGDEPWASRRFVISTMFLILLFAKLGLDYLLSHLRFRKASHD
ncbi:hypothetical protein N9453_01070 [Aquiluna sp.]|nr:hypothetical protein [Aquiluna sp.]